MLSRPPACISVFHQAVYCLHSYGQCPINYRQEYCYEKNNFLYSKTCFVTDGGYHSALAFAYDASRPTPLRTQHSLKPQFPLFHAD